MVRLERETGPETTSLLSVRGLRTYFFQDEGTVKAVDGVDLDVSPGQVLCVVGESGCGKSVTARSILGLVERPGRVVAGEIWWSRGGQHGRAERVDLVRLDPDGAEIRAIRGAEIGFIFQEPMTSFSPVHTIGNQIIEAITIHQDLTRADARARAVELLRQVGVSRPEPRLDEYAYQMSGGLRQRAMIAMALACDPSLLIADEPTTALDVTTQAQILDLLRRLRAERNMAVMLITHNLGVVAEMADDVAVMYLGRIVERGSVEDIFYDPKHPYTKALLRSRPSIDAVPLTHLPTISGAIPHPYNRPGGCPFHPRCPECMPGVCDRDEPGVVTVGPAHTVDCFLYGRGERP